MTWNVDDKVRKEAEQWFARLLEPSVRDAEREAFENWRGQNPRRAEVYAETERLWDELAVLKQSQRLRVAVPNPAVSEGMQRTTWQHVKTRRPLFLALAAGFAAIAILAVGWLNRGTPLQTFVTALGEQRTETLADGTTLRLNTSSTLEVQMTDRHRSITLRSGEVAFDVAKDRSRPFVVTAGDGTITAVGTQFQVRHEANTVAVTLIEGRVKLARQSRREVEWLDPGQQATFSGQSSGIVRRNVDLAVLTGWMNGRLEFRSTPLQQAVAEANRYSARKIRIGDPAMRDLAVSGTFRTGDVDAVAIAFEAAFPVRVYSDEKEVVLYGRREASSRQR